jgi:Uma2 family endonuclease
MSVIESPPAKKLLTAEEFLALPDDGKERWLIRGEVRPLEPAMTVRNRKHGRVEARIAKLLGVWLDHQAEPRGEVLSGEVGFRLRSDPGSLIGIDVAYASADLVARTEGDVTYYDGPPVLAVEILSPSDKHEEVVRKINEYLGAGVVVWEVDPDFQTVRVHRPGHAPEGYNHSQELCGDPYLPGFRVEVSQIFMG